tara:strand:- start:3746 stop:3892 length:147 start_codon:yes stop_codon:yes gene_type:complete
MTPELSCRLVYASNGIVNQLLNAIFSISEDCDTRLQFQVTIVSPIAKI